jgi:hypothetical protein
MHIGQGIPAFTFDEQSEDRRQDENGLQAFAEKNHEGAQEGGTGWKSSHCEFPLGFG